MERRFALLVVVAACKTAGSLPPISNHVHASEACDRLAGAIHDLDQDDAPAVGATIIAAGIAKHEDVATSDRDGWFVFPELSSAQRRVTVLYNDLAFTSTMPARRCLPMWLGVHGSTQRYETPLVIR